MILLSTNSQTSTHKVRDQDGSLTPEPAEQKQRLLYENPENTHNTHDMAASALLNQADVAMLDTCSRTQSGVHTLGKIGYLYFLVRLYQKLVSEGVAKDDVCLKQLISEIKSISLDDDNNL
jgi:hypothetical protein